MIIKENILSEILYLRTLTLEDCTEKYVNWLNNIEVNRYLETRFYVQNQEMIKDFVVGVNNSEDSYLFGIFTDDNIHIGNIKIGPIHPIYKYADISYFIGDTLFRGKGFAKNAIKLVLKFGFNQLNLNRIQAGVHGTNISSQKVLEKCGFIKEAELRKKIFFEKENEIIWDDHYFYGILRIEYI